MYTNNVSISQYPGFTEGDASGGMVETDTHFLVDVGAECDLSLATAFVVFFLSPEVFLCFCW